MNKKAAIPPVIKQMMDDKARVEKQLQAGYSLTTIGIKIVSPVTISPESAR